MEISNTESIPGRRIVEFYGVVTGNTVRAKHIGRDIMAGLKNIVGGELVGYTELLQDSRMEATERMIEQAKQAIDGERAAAVAELKAEVAKLSLEIAEQLVRKELSDDGAQQDLIGRMISDSKLN